MDIICVFSAVPVAFFQEDGLFSTSTYLEYRGDLASEAAETDLDLSVCYRVRVRHLRGSHSYFVSFAFRGEENAFTAGRIAYFA